MIYSGAVTISFQNRTTIVNTDTLGKGSILGTYSCFSDEEIIFGAHAANLSGVCCIVLDKENIGIIRRRYNKIDNLFSKLEKQV